jgi:hypothetical protein
MRCTSLPGVAGCRWNHPRRDRADRAGRRPNADAVDQPDIGNRAVSENTFRRYVLPHVRTIAVDKVRIVSVVELERWPYLNARFADEE